MSGVKIGVSTYEKLPIYAEKSANQTIIRSAKINRKVRLIHEKFALAIKFS